MEFDNEDQVLFCYAVFVLSFLLMYLCFGNVTIFVFVLSIVIVIIVIDVLVVVVVFPHYGC